MSSPLTPPTITPPTITPKVHVHMRVSDLAKSRAFYETLFGAGPVKEKPGYVKFLPDWAPVNLALSEGQPGTVGAVDHLGIQLASTDAVLAQLGRIKASGLPVREQMGVDCCHANQDKFWVHDPDGVEWEIYHLNYDLDEETTGAQPAGSSLRLASLPLRQGGGCCAS